MEENTSQEGKEQEKPETQQEIKEQEMQINPVEIKIIKQFRHLPDVFMLKTKYGEVEKITLIPDHFVDCSKYVSKSKLTFEGCYKYQNNQLEESRGIYYTPVASVISVYSRNKITRDLEEMKQKILSFLQFLGLKNQKLLVWYDNYVIEIYDKYKKGELIEFNKVTEQGHLEIYNVPSPKYVRPDEFEIVRNIQIYNHTLETNVDIKVYHPYSSPGLAYLLYVPEFVTIRIISPDHQEKFADLYSGQYYLVTHPLPRNNRID